MSVLAVVRKSSSVQPPTTLPHRLSLLSLAGPRHAAGGGRAVGIAVLLQSLLRGAETLCAAGESPPHFLDIRHLFVLHLDQCTRGPTATLLDRFFVGADVEADEQHQITRQYPHARESGEFLSSARPGRGQPGEVARGEVGVGGEVDEAEVDDELGDLQHGDVFFPPDADAAGGLEVVPVHDDVHG